MKKSAWIFLFLISCLHLQCSDTAQLRNQLLLGTWFIVESTVNLYEGETVTSSIFTENAGALSFYEDGTGEYWIGDTYYYYGYVEEIVWNNSDDLIVLIIQDEPYYFDVLSNNRNEQVWRSLIEQDDGTSIETIWGLRR